VRRFIVVGQTAKSSGDFLLVDIPSTSGRVDVLLRSLRAALLVSHGVRRDTRVYLLLLGDAAEPRTLRIDGAAARYLRPDERSLATTLKKALATPCESAAFVPVRPGIAIAKGDVDTLLSDLTGCAIYLLEPGAPDIRSVQFDAREPVFVLGDHLGFSAAIRSRWLQLGAQPVSVGPTQLFSEDVIAIVSNELDRALDPSGVTP
jgi:tRNA (pseudouridine54-N1)-methyltransferase